ncbi:MAG: glycosyltransferase family 4 protein [Huintestinicola sp.]
MKTILYYDITNFMNIFFVNNYLSGVQRVVKEFANRFISDNSADVYLLVWTESIEAFRVVDNEKLRKSFENKDNCDSDVYTGKVLKVEDLKSGSLFLDVDNVWNAKFRRNSLYPKLKNCGIRIITFIHDIIPITHPHLAQESTVYNFMMYTSAFLTYSDMLITTTAAVGDEVDKLCDRLGRKRIPRCVVPLGADFMEGSEGQEDVDPQVVSKVEKMGKYMLMVGTVEPRKNHKLAIDALEEKLADKGISLVIAGKFGWNVEELRNRIETHRLNGKKLFFFERPNDDTIRYLYKNAFIVAFPTFNEGFGLPVIESLQLGTPVLASDIGVLREISGDYIDYFELNNKDDFAEQVIRLAEDEEYYRSKKEKIKKFVPFTWMQSSELMMKSVLSASVPYEAADGNKLTQLIMTADDMDSASAALEGFDKHLPFIRKAAVITDCDSSDMKYSGRIDVSFVKRNGLSDAEALRKFAVGNAADDMFLFANDKMNPIADISSSYYAEGEYFAYYSRNTDKENNASLIRDDGKAVELLKKRSLPYRIYADCQPQVFDKSILSSMTDEIPTSAEIGSACTVYFNYAVSRFPERFRIKKYETMCPSYTEGYQFPDSLTFEYCVNSDYEDCGVFSGMSRAHDENSLIARVCRFNEYVRQSENIRERNNAYVGYYTMQKKEVPSFVVFALNSDVIIRKPTYISVPAGRTTDIPILFDPSLMSRLGLNNVMISSWIRTRTDEEISPISTFTAELKDGIINVPVTVPDIVKECVLRIGMSFDNQEMTKSLSMGIYIT